MDIYFKQINDHEIDIVATAPDGKGERKIGHIFSPSGSGENITNAIQVCGFDEAFDLWGCGIFGERLPDELVKVKIPESRLEYAKDSAERLKSMLSQEEYEDLKKGIHTEHHHRWKMKKDIQLLFSVDGSGSGRKSISEFDFNAQHCHRCYSNPCHCENKKGGVPFNVKRSDEIEDKLEDSRKTYSDTTYENPEFEKDTLG
jgi:hypothetical protein